MNKLVEQFCTPPTIPLTDFDVKALSDTKNIIIPFEEDEIHCYVKGEGKTIILGHGWGSRASHMALIGRFLAKAGFKVVMFDAPAHSSTKTDLSKTKSSMFEYCRALHKVASYFSPVYAVVAHSLGSISTIFTASAYSMLSNYQIEAEKYVLLSMPSSLNLLLQSFCKQNNYDDNSYTELKKGLEEEFNMSTDEYNIASAITNIKGDILIIHDEDDEEIPVDNIYTIKDVLPTAHLFLTKGSGHSKILMNRKMISKVVEFLK